MEVHPADRERKGVFQAEHLHGQRHRGRKEGDVGTLSKSQGLWAKLVFRKTAVVNMEAPRPESRLEDACSSPGEVP